MNMYNRLRKQGVVFSLDAAIAVSVIIILLINSAYYFSTSSRESFSQLQPVRIGSDIIAIYDHLDIFDQIIFTDPVVETTVPHGFYQQSLLNLSTYLPANYDMKIFISDMAESVVNGTNILLSDPFSACNQPGENYCVLSPSESITVATLPIDTAGDYNLLVKTNETLALDSFPMTATVNATAKLVALRYFDQPNVYLFDKFYFEQGKNNVSFNNSLTSGDIQIEWFRVLGDFSYALTNDKTVPNDRFIGTGERFISVEDETTFYGFYNVRYLIWLKSTPS